MFGAHSRTRPERPEGDNRSDSLSLSKGIVTTAKIFELTRVLRRAFRRPFLTAQLYR